MFKVWQTFCTVEILRKETAKNRQVFYSHETSILIGQSSQKCFIGLVRSDIHIQFPSKEVSVFSVRVSIKCFFFIEDDSEPVL